MLYRSSAERQSKDSHPHVKKDGIDLKSFEVTKELLWWHSANLNREGGEILADTRISF